MVPASVLHKAFTGQLTSNIAGFPGDEEIETTLFLTLPGHPLSTAAPFTVSPLANAVSGNVSFSAKDDAHLHFFDLLSTAGRTLSPTFDNFTVTVSITPEPASWAMIIGGFGLVGASMRRRSGRPAHAA